MKKIFVLLLMTAFVLSACSASKAEEDRDVETGMCMARIIDTGSGEMISEINAPENGTVFFIQSNPLAFSDSQLILLVR